MSSGAGSVSTPWQPLPKMHSHDDAMNVTSTCQRLRSLPRLGIVTHSRFGAVMWILLGGRTLFANLVRRTSAAGKLGSLRIIDSADALLNDLRAALGPDRASAEPLELALYARDAGVGEGRALAVCFPRAAHEV